MEEQDSVVFSSKWDICIIHHPQQGSKITVKKEVERLQEPDVETSASKQYLPGMARPLYVWTHSSFDSRHKTWATSIQPKYQHAMGKGEEAPPQAEKLLAIWWLVEESVFFREVAPERWPMPQ